MRAGISDKNANPLKTRLDLQFSNLIFLTTELFQTPTLLLPLPGHLHVHDHLRAPHRERAKLRQDRSSKEA